MPDPIFCRYAVTTGRQIRRPPVKRLLAVVLLVAATAAGPLAMAVEAGGPAAESFVVQGTSAGRADAIRNHAERFRNDVFARLLGTVAPEAWAVRCVIHVHASADSFTEALGGGPSEARGATSLQFVGDRVISRRIDVMGDGSAIVPDSLAHEIVHVVLADHFVAAAPPRWADEGLALLFDDPVKQRAHEEDFRAAQSRRLAWSVADLLQLEEYPEDARRQRVFYGQSAALVRWLVARKDAAAFIRFLDDCQSTGTAAALRTHYGIESVDAMGLAWRESPPIHAISLAD
jgi:hypothetical protein